MSTLGIVLVVAVYIEQESVAESNDTCGGNSLKIAIITIAKSPARGRLVLLI